MITQILNYIKRDNKRVLPKWERLNNDLDARQQIQILRFLNVELPDAPHVVLIEQIIKSYIEDIQELIFLKDNFRRCAHLIGPKIRLTMEQRLDSIRAQPIFLKTFFCSSPKMVTSESLIPVSYRDPLIDLPLAPYQTEQFYDLNPIRIWYTNSSEFISNLVPQSRPRYISDPPSIGIVTVDFLLLTLKLLNFIDVEREMGKTTFSIRTFLKEEVFVHMYKDLREMWMLSFIEKILECESIEGVRELCVSNKDNRFALQDYSPYAEELFGFLQDMKEGSIDPEVMLNANLLEDRSILDRAREVEKHLTVRDLRQYQHLDLSIQLPMVRIILKFLSYSKNPYFKKSIVYQLERDIRLLKRTNVHTQYRNKRLKNWLMTQLDEIYVSLAYMK